MKKINIILLMVFGILSLGLTSCSFLGSNNTPTPQWSNDLVQKMAQSMGNDIK